MHCISVIPNDGNVFWTLFLEGAIALANRQPLGLKYTLIFTPYVESRQMSGEIRDLSYVRPVFRSTVYRNGMWRHNNRGTVKLNVKIHSELNTHSGAF